MLAAGEQQPAIWQLLEELGAEGSCWGGACLYALQRYSEPSWRGPAQKEGLFGVLDEGQVLMQELHWEVEAKLMNVLAFITSRKDVVLEDKLHNSSLQISVHHSIILLHQIK